MTEQTYANHRHRPVLWLVTILCSAIGVLAMLAFVVRQPSILTIGWSLVALAGFLTAYMVRQYALRLQNRIIRLEMQLRLGRLGREADLDRLTMRQIVALRFASEPELPGLIDRTLAEQLTADQIKRAVSTWRGDYLRT